MDAAALPLTLAALPPSLLERLPFFFYGTLMRGYKNHTAIVADRFESLSPARLVSPSAVLVHYEAGYPGLFETPGSGGSGVVVGELCMPRDGGYFALMEELDALEEYYGPDNARNVYERVVREVHVRGADGMQAEVRAWVYICRIADGSIPSCPVPSGDWREFMREKGLEDAADDWSATLAARTAEVKEMVG